MLGTMLPTVCAKGGDVMPRLTSSNRVFSPRVVMSCHARRLSTSVLGKGDDGMPRPTSFDRVCCPKAVI